VSALAGQWRGRQCKIIGCDAFAQGEWADPHHDGRAARLARPVRRWSLELEGRGDAVGAATADITGVQANCRARGDQVKSGRLNTGCNAREYVENIILMMAG
jgi:hypothetical protein